MDGDISPSLQLDKSVRPYIFTTEWAETYLAASLNMDLNEFSTKKDNAVDKYFVSVGETALPPEQEVWLPILADNYRLKTFEGGPLTAKSLKLYEDGKLRWLDVVDAWVGEAASQQVVQGTYARMLKDMDYCADERYLLINSGNAIDAVNPSNTAVFLNSGDTAVFFANPDDTAVFFSSSDTASNQNLDGGFAADGTPSLVVSGVWSGRETFDIFQDRKPTLDPCKSLPKEPNPPEPDCNACARTGGVVGNEPTKITVATQYSTPDGRGPQLMPDGPYPNQPACDLMTEIWVSKRADLAVSPWIGGPKEWTVDAGTSYYCGYFRSIEVKSPPWNRVSHKLRISHLISSRLSGNAGWCSLLSEN